MELDQLTDEQIATLTAEQVEMLENDPSKVSEIFAEKESDKDKAEDKDGETTTEPKQEVKESAANGAGEPEPVVQTKNGKGIIPYEKHKELRVENSTLRQQLQDAQSKLNELQKAKDEAKTPKEEAKADDAIAENLNRLKDEMPDIHTVVTAVREENNAKNTKSEKQVEKMEKQLAELLREKEEAELERQMTVKEQVAEAKDNNPDLSHWEANDPEAWDEALRQDEILRTTSKWTNKPYAERFEEVARRVRAIMPDASAPKKQPEPETVKADAKAKIEKSEVRKPTTLSDIQGVSSLTSEDEEMRNMDPHELTRKLMTMPDHKAKALRAKFD